MRQAGADEAEEVVGVIFPADEDATLPLYPGEKALDEPASYRLSRRRSCGRLTAAGTVRRDHLDAVVSQLLIQRIAVIGAIAADQISSAWLRSCRSRSIAAPSGLRDGSQRVRADRERRL